MEVLKKWNGKRGSLFLRSLFFLLILFTTVSAIALYRQGDYAFNSFIQYDFKVIPSPYSIISLSYNLTPLIDQHLIGANCSGLVVSNGTNFNATYSWVQNFGVSNCLDNGQNSTILIRYSNWNNVIVANLTLSYGNQTVDSGLVDYGNFSQVFLNYDFAGIFNSTSGGANYTDFAHNYYTGSKTSTSSVTDFPSGYGVSWNSGFVSYSDSSNYKPTIQFTLTCLVKPNPSGSYIIFGSHGKGGGTIGYEGRERPDKKIEAYGTDLGNTLISSGTLNDNELYLVTFVINGASSAIYINKTVTTGTTSTISYDSDNPLCIGGQSYSNSCHAFDPGEASYCYLIGDAVTSNYTNSTVDQQITYYNPVLSYISVSDPKNINYSSFTIPYNVSSLIQTVNISVTSSSCGSFTIFNLVSGTFNNSNVNCLNTKNNWIQFNATTGTTQLEVKNVSFYIFPGVNFSLVNAGNFSLYNFWSVNVSNSTNNFTFNSGVNTSLLIAFDDLPIGTLNYSFNPNNSLIFYPDKNNLQGGLIVSNTSFINVSGNAWFRQDFYVNSSSGFIQNWTGNLTYINGSSATFVTNSFVLNFSLQQFVNKSITLNAFAFGFGNQSFTGSFNGSSPYLNQTINVSLAGLNLSLFQELTGLNINGSCVLSNGTSSYNITLVNNSQTWNFTNFTLLPLGISETLSCASSGYFPRTYVISLDPYTLVSLNAYLPIQNSFSILVRFLVVNNNVNNPIQGATVIIQRFSGGTWVTVGSQITDSSGTASFYMDSSQTYTVIGTFGTATSTNVLQPTRNDYTIVLNQGALGNYTYLFNNVSFAFKPTSFRLVNDTNTFGCEWNSGPGFIQWFSTNIKVRNSTTENYTTIFDSNITTSPNGGANFIPVSSVNRSDALLYCCFVANNQPAYCINNTYYFNPIPNTDNGIIGIEQDISNSGPSVFLAIIGILIAVYLGFRFGGANDFMGVGIFIAVIGFLFATNLISFPVFGGGVMLTIIIYLGFIR